jgi:glycosyltransferase involved in cell wall biosynthesis
MPKILYLITEDWFLVSHFLPMARAARERGFEVVVATQVKDHGARIAAEGIRLIPLEVERRSLGLFEGVSNLARTFRIVRAERPDIVHCIALRPVVLGGLAAKLAGVRRLVLAPTGLGQLWIADDAMARLARKITRAAVGSWLHGPQTHYLFENREDPLEFGLDPEGANVTIVGGAGVAPEEFPASPEPAAPPLKVAVVARMIAPKGIAEAVEATRRARSLGAAVELDLYGPLDSTDRRAIPEAMLKQWSTEPGIRWRGRTDDVAGVWREHHVAMFLSTYREGVPRTLIEAAAAGRPIITTDMPGCRDLVRDGREGLLVPSRDVDAAARALLKLARDPALRARLGAAAHRRFHEGYTEAAVKNAVSGVYQSLLQAP